jgi:hypothetical protein
MRLCWSRMAFRRIYPRETQEMVFDAHACGFAYFGGVPLRGIYDYMKTPVTTVFAGKERAFNRRFLVMMDHHRIEPVAWRHVDGRVFRAGTLRSGEQWASCSFPLQHERIAGHGDVPYEVGSCLQIPVGGVNVGVPHVRCERGHTEPCRSSAPAKPSRNGPHGPLRRCSSVFGAEK